MTIQESKLIELEYFLNTHPWIMLLLVFLAVWVLVWKGIALWKAARNESKAWYIVMLVVNTLGILEIIYIFFFSKNKDS